MSYDVGDAKGRDPSGDVEWRRYVRRGEVTAVKRMHERSWMTAGGETMIARPGDWDVVDDLGDVRSVAAGIFEATHEQVGPSRYRRCGTVMARPSLVGEVVTTLEGEVTARLGDWIVEGSRGERWPVPASKFRSAYEGPVDE